MSITAFHQQRNDACLFDSYYEIWYKRVCEGGAANRLTVRVFADSACRKQAKKKVVHSLSHLVPGINQCVRAGGNSSAVEFEFTYCYNEGIH